MLMLLLVVFDFGRGFMEYVSVSNGARDGARIAAQFDYDCTQAADRNIIRNAAAAAAGPLPSPVVTVTDGGDGTCSITVAHQYQMVLPFSPLIMNPVTLPLVGTVGPVWDGNMSETMVSS